MWSLPLRVSCPGPLPRLACLGGGAVRSRFPPTWLLLRGASEVRRSPSPDCRPLGGLLGSATHVLWARVCGVGAQCCPLGLHALWGLRAAGVVWWWGVPGGGVACHCCEGRLVSGAVPPPTARPLGGLPGPPTHWLWVRGGAGVGTHHQPHRARSCELALRAVLGATKAPGAGAPPAWVCGVRGRALSHPRVPALSAGCRGPLPTGCGCGGCGRGDPSPPPQRALLRAVAVA